MKFIFCVMIYAASIISLVAAEFGARQAMGTITDSRLSEISGIVAGRTNPGIFWIHNDSDNDARIYAINSKAVIAGEMVIDGAKNVDYEDIGAGPGPVAGANYIYIGDHGDNNAKRDAVSIIRIMEPAIDTLGEWPFTAETTTYETINLTYPDGARDAEAMFVDPASGDIYIISKRETKVRVYRAAYPQSTTGTTALEYLMELPFGSMGIPGYGVTGADISIDGKEILIKTYMTVYYFKRADGESITDALKKSPVTLDYSMEPQGEGICWDITGSGYYTLSEFGSTSESVLYFYPRLGSSVKKKDELNGAEVVGSNGIITIDFSNCEALPESIGLYDITGRLIEEVQQVDEFVNIPENGLKNGIYLLSFRFGNRWQAKVVTVL